MAPPSKPVAGGSEPSEGSEPESRRVTTDLVERLAAPLAAAGLNILLPLSEAAFDAACAAAPALPIRLGDLLAGATRALVLGSGGRDFFPLFRASPEAADGAPDPLDRYTRRVVQEALTGTRGDRARAFFPFVGSAPVLPFQRLGRAAGLGPSSPLGVQIHPFYGPWWAYRAVLAIKDDDRDAAPAPAPAPQDLCLGCEAPCIAACPGSAVRREGFSVPACHARRLAPPGQYATGDATAADCRLSCVARIRCVRGPEHRYSDEQLAFHMKASMPARL